MSRNLDYRRGVTLAELLVALAILAVLSTAIATLLNGAGRTYQYVNRESDAMQQVENAYRRILQNVRSASTLGAVASNSFTITTNYGGPATITYKLVGSNLVEDDPRYNPAASTPNVILYHCRTFSVTQETVTSPTQLTITIASDTDPVVTRTARIACRNF